jgi:hypothetical protein
LEVENENYDPSKSQKKGLAGAGTATVGGAVTTLLLVGVTVAAGGGVDEAAKGVIASALVTLGSAATAGIFAWWRNRKKHRTRQAYVPPSTGMVVIFCALALGGLLSGCAKTVGLDGSVTYTIDPGAVDTAFATWDRLDARRKALEEEKAAAKKAEDAERVKVIEEQLRLLKPELDDAWAAVQARVDGS